MISLLHNYIDQKNKVKWFEAMSILLKSITIEKMT